VAVEELADPRVVARLAADAEERGWDGVFVWDQLRWREPIRHVADPWVTLAAIATVTTAPTQGSSTTTSSDLTLAYEGLEMAAEPGLTPHLHRRTPFPLRRRSASACFLGSLAGNGSQHRSAQGLYRLRPFARV
jgi:hypothetical protein